MTDDLKHTFVLDPGKKSRYPAGPYDKQHHTPRYEIEIDILSHARSQVEINQVLMGGGG